MRELGRIADVTRGMLPFITVTLTGVLMAYPEVSVGLPSDIVGEG